jgi:hypothetical protein
METLPLPTVRPVTVTLHAPDERVQGLVDENVTVPVPGVSWENVTVPVGVGGGGDEEDGPVTAVTVAVHVVDEPIIMDDGLQITEVVVKAKKNGSPAST